MIQTINQLIGLLRKRGSQMASGKSLAESLGQEQKEESGFRTFLSYAAPLVAMGLLPIGGAALAPLITGALGKGALTGLGGAALKALGTGLGHRTISEVLERGGRAFGAGGEEEEIVSTGQWGKQAQKEAQELYGESQADYGKAQNYASMIAGLMAGADAGFGDELKAKAGEFGRKISDKFLGTGASSIPLPMNASESPFSIPTSSSPLKYNMGTLPKPEASSFLQDQMSQANMNEKMLGAKDNILDRLVGAGDDATTNWLKEMGVDMPGDVLNPEELMPTRFSPTNIRQGASISDSILGNLNKVGISSDIPTGNMLERILQGLQSQQAGMGAERKYPRNIAQYFEGGY